MYGFLRVAATGPDHPPAQRARVDRRRHPLHGWLHFAGPARKFIDNMRSSRAGRGGVARTLSRAEIEDELGRLVSVRGTEALSELRDKAREVAGLLDATTEVEALDDLIGAILGTRAHRRGFGFDPRRLELFDALQSHLLRTPLPSRPERLDSFPALSFIEAYLSNWIEGTEFELEEAKAIVFERAVPEGRFEDAHDVLGTFELVDSPDLRARVPTGPDDLIARLRSHHALMPARRPAVNPGSFKLRPNRAGATTFVHPNLVEGTLREGYPAAGPRARLRAGVRGGDRLERPAQGRADAGGDRRIRRAGDRGGTGSPAAPAIAVSDRRLAG